MELLLRSLRLGTKTNINVADEGKSFSWKTAAIVVAFRLLRLVEAVRREPIPRDGLAELAMCGVGRRPDGSTVLMMMHIERQLAALEDWGQHGAGSLLPSLSRGAAAQQWAKETPALFRLVFGADFDQHPKSTRLEGIRCWAALGILLEELRGPGVIRQLMLQSVKQAWGSLAALD